MREVGLQYWGPISIGEFSEGNFAIFLGCNFLVRFILTCATYLLADLFFEIVCKKQVFFSKF